MSSVNVGLPYLRVGSGGQLVQSIQEQLQRSDLFSGGVDGTFGQQAEQAVRAFQRSCGLYADGIVEPDTWVALVEAGFDPDSGPAQPPPGPRSPQSMRLECSNPGCARA